MFLAFYKTCTKDALKNVLAVVNEGIVNCYFSNNTKVENCTKCHDWNIVFYKNKHRYVPENLWPSARGTTDPKNNTSRNPFKNLSRTFLRWFSRQKGTFFLKRIPGKRRRPWLCILQRGSKPKTHPWPGLRAKEISKTCECGEKQLKENNPKGSNLTRHIWS